MCYMAKLFCRIMVWYCWGTKCIAIDGYNSALAYVVVVTSMNGIAITYSIYEDNVLLTGLYTAIILMY